MDILVFIKNAIKKISGPTFKNIKYAIILSKSYYLIKKKTNKKLYTKIVYYLKNNHYENQRLQNLVVGFYLNNLFMSFYLNLL